MRLPLWGSENGACHATWGVGKEAVTHPAYAAMLELGRAQRTIFHEPGTCNRDLQREINAGRNVVGLQRGNDYIFFGKSGELSSNRREEQEISMICLQILQSCLGYVNTLIQDTLAEPDGPTGSATPTGAADPAVHR